jgi:O-antigen/teichoic acid export membrane protein
MGISMATENRIARVRHLKDDSVQRVFWSALMLNLATGILGSGLIWVGAYVYVQHIATIEPVFQREVLDALPWIALAVPIANVSWVLSGAITALERFVLLNVNQTIGTFMLQLLPLAAIYMVSPSLAVVVPAAVIARFLALVLLGWGTFRALHIRSIRMPEWRLIVELIDYGRWIVLLSGANVISSTLDRVVIGAMLGARYVAYYSAPQNLVSRLDMLPSAMLRTLFPRFSASESHHADDLSYRSLALLNCVFTPCMIVALFALTPFMHIWLGHDIAEHAAPVGRVLVMAVWLTGQWNIISVLIQAKAKPAGVALIGWIGLPVFAVVLWLGIRWGGIVGAAVAVVVKAYFDYAAFLFLSKLAVRPILRNMLGHLAFMIVATACADLMDSLTRMAAVCVALLAGNLAWSLFESSELRGVAAQIRRRFLYRAE